jgi:ribonuclease HI
VANMLGVIMVYDSQYTKDACTAPPHVPKPVKNRTAIVVCQRTLQAAADKRVLVRWVKVKGHSNEEGNDMADKLADYAQKGGAQNEQDIAMMMAGLQATDD